MLHYRITRHGRAFLTAALVVLPGFARAQSTWHVRGDAHFAGVLSGPQWLEYGLGGGGGGEVEWAPFRAAGIVVRGDALALAPASHVPAAYAHPGVGTSVSAMLGVRVHPMSSGLGAQSDGVWIEAAAGGAYTGDSVRPAVSFRAGVSYAVGALATGPFIGYSRMFDTGGQSVLPGDAQIALAGIEISHAFTRTITPTHAPVVASVPHSVCPAASHLLFEDADHDGCADADRDVDGVADFRDRCPDVAEDRDGFEDGDGCPDSDNDRDGILDLSDACPNEPETINGVDDLDGCPDEAPVHVADGRIQLNDTIEFAFNSARVLPESFALVAAVARVLHAHPEYRTVFIEGHTDEIGDDRYNFNLSFQRARAVIDLLGEDGVQRGRLVALGFGRSNPLDVTHGASARAVNRRVDFVVNGHRTIGMARVAGGWTRITEPVEAAR